METPGCTPLKVAILISGQLSRFVYREQTGALLSSKSACPPTADVFIALQTGKPYQPYKGRIDRIPYDSTPHAIEKWYVGRGARKAVAVFIGSGDIHRMEASVRKFIRESKGGSRLDASIKKSLIKDHYQANLRQYYMRCAHEHKEGI